MEEKICEKCGKGFKTIQALLSHVRIKHQTKKKENQEDINPKLEGDSDILALQKQLEEAKLRRKIRETNLPFQIEKQVSELNKRYKEADELIGHLCDEIRKIPLAGIYERFTCRLCKNKGFIAVSVKCTVCDRETWSGVWPEE